LNEEENYKQQIQDQAHQIKTLQQSIPNLTKLQKKILAAEI
jgi:hypothetical protein